MTSTAQMVRSKETTSNSNWSSTFPNQMKTQEESCTLMKKLLAVAVSEILYMRAIFPEDAFGDRKIEDLNLKILSDSSNNPGVCEVISWMRGCFQALEKKYLRQIMLAVYLDQDKPDEVIESYTFRFAYHDDATSVTCNDEEVLKTTSAPKTMEEIRKATVSLLRTTVLLTQYLEPLPETAFLGMKLLYYDEVTPEDYEPEGFVSSLNSNYSFVNEPLNVKVGEVNTQYHMMKLRVKTDKTQFEYDVDPLSASAKTITVPEEPQVTSTKSASVLAVSQVLPAKLPTATLPMDINSNENSAKNHFDKDEIQAMELLTDTAIRVESQESVIPTDNNLENPMECVMDHFPTAETTRPDSPGDESTVSESSVKSHGGAVRCPCGDNENDGMMVQCVGCRYWQHGVCFSLLNDENLPDKHYCHICGNPEDPRKPPTDFYLNSLDNIRQKGLCMWRRTLNFCSEKIRLEDKQLRLKLNTNSPLAQALIKRLNQEGFVTSGKGKGRGKRTYYVKKDVLLSDGFPKYMTRQESRIEDDYESDTGNEPSAKSIPFSKAEIPSVSKASEMVKSSILQEQVNGLTEKTNLLSVSEEVLPKAKKAKISKRKQLYPMNLDLNESQDNYGTRSRTLNKRQKVSVANKGLAV